MAVFHGSFRKITPLTHHPGSEERSHPDTVMQDTRSDPSSDDKSNPNHSVIEGTYLPELVLRPPGRRHGPSRYIAVLQLKSQFLREANQEWRVQQKFSVDKAPVRSA